MLHKTTYYTLFKIIFWAPSSSSDKSNVFPTYCKQFAPTSTYENTLPPYHDNHRKGPSCKWHRILAEECSRSWSERFICTGRKKKERLRANQLILRFIGNSSTIFTSDFVFFESDWLSKCTLMEIARLGYLTDFLRYSDLFLFPPVTPQGQSWLWTLSNDSSTFWQIMPPLAEAEKVIPWT